MNVQTHCSSPCNGVVRSKDGDKRKRHVMLALLAVLPPVASYRAKKIARWLADMLRPVCLLGCVRDLAISSAKSHPHPMSIACQKSICN